MNLQICVPYRPCAYNCPMCVAKGHTHGYHFKNLYKENREEYLDRLRDFIKGNDEDIRDIIITGECDPVMDMEFVNYVMWYLRMNFSNKHIEFQTHCFNLDPMMFRVLPDVLSYSITCCEDYMSSYKLEKFGNEHNRLVILLTNDFEFLNKRTFEPFGFDQVTFKRLQYGEDIDVNKWIAKNMLRDESKIREIVDFWNGGYCSVRLDTSCQKADGRYYIFRSDGKVYSSWETSEPMLDKN